MALIHAKDLTVSSRIDHISVDIQKGKLVGIIGANGSGKSTLLEVFAGLQVYEGEYQFEGEAFQTKHLKTYAKRIGFLPQKHEAAWSLAVEDIVSLGRIPWEDNDSAAISRAMSLTDVTSFKNKWVDQLSGGQQARVWLARVLAGSPEIILADEPLASLDVFHQLSVMRLFRELVDNEGLTVVLSIHDLSMAARFCDELILLSQGQLLAHGEAETVLTEEHIERAFNTPMLIDLESVPPIILPK